MPKKSKLKKRPKNICICGRKMSKVIEDCCRCGGGEYYECPDYMNCCKVYDVDGEEI